MAKKKEPVFQDVEEVTPLTTLLRHTNKQSYSADASTAIAESIDNPGWDTAGKRGIQIESIVFMPGKGSLFGKTSSGPHTTQLQVGDHTDTPALVDPNDSDLFAAFSFYNSYVTNGGGKVEWPVTIPVFSVVPIIVAEHFTICHDAVNDAAYNSMDLFTLIYYRIVQVPLISYNAMLMQRLNQS